MPDESVDKAILTLFYAFASGDLPLAKFMIRIKKLQDYCIKNGLIPDKKKA